MSLAAEVGGSEFVLRCARTQDGKSGLVALWSLASKIARGGGSGLVALLSLAGGMAQEQSQLQ